ncbi:two pore calcium channel protein 2-like [Micropterus salmoides]|uniref:two pore calcium channel protein 2-like n=1 Tax=Micropterus salmoides TaxID=27706 RepID=UPI0018ED149D|nr:two pore calcium channel protein 2-like [Micropterus salmoides]
MVCLLIFSLDLAVKSYLIGWEEFRKSKWLIGYTVVISASIIDWVLSVSMVCDERHPAAGTPPLPLHYDRHAAVC